MKPLAPVQSQAADSSHPASLVTRGIRNYLFLLGFLLCHVSPALSAESLPPPPPRYFNDYAGVVPPQTAQQLNSTLENFEKTDSTQILVVIYPSLPQGPALEDFTVRTASSWRVGQKAKDNGAILFIFMQDRRMRIEVGYGLEGALPDALAKRIIEEQIKPWFQRGDYAQGVTGGVQAILQAVRGEYRGSPTSRGLSRNNPSPLLFFLLLFLIFLLPLFRRRGTVYSPMGRRRYYGAWGAGGWGGGGWSSRGGGGFGGFSGGGGRFGGGGASGSW